VETLFSNFIAEHQLFSPQDSLLVAVSGGIDSMVLAHLLHQTGYRFSLAHVNFGLRGDESEGDEQFVLQTAEKYSVACFTKYLNAQWTAEKEQISIQMAARKLRYEWFLSLLKQYGYQYVLTAHHQNDVLETVLYNLVRGTGIAGLHGIQPKQNHLVRPLLFATKQEVLQYAQAQNLAWREDSSNKSSKYHRNLLRNEVIPLLKKINPTIEATLQQTVEKVAAVERIFEEQINLLAQKVTTQEGNIIYIDIALLNSEKELLIKLFYLLKPYNFNYTQTQQIIETLYRPAGRLFESDTHTLVKDRTHLVISPRTITDFTPLQVSKTMNIAYNQHLSLHIQQFTKPAEYEIEKSASVACIDKQKLVFPLVARTWRQGDKFQPLGMKGMKKISDFLIDKKIPLNLKDKIWVLCNGNGEIVWVIGHRIDDRYKVTTNTTEVYRVALQPY
jgi:tRNA(Ile)-lysidine synthase